MWPNQAAEAENKNMTSLKNKITHRKRKNSKSKGSSAQLPDASPAPSSGASPASKKLQNPDAARKQPGGRHRKNSTGTPKGAPKKGGRAPERAGPDAADEKKGGRGIEVDATCNRADVTQLTNGARNREDSRGESSSPDVRLEAEPRADTFDEADCSAELAGDGVVGDASDTFDELGADVSFRGRVHSELIAVEGKADKAERKSRRFSDIFRYGGLKPASSCENIKSNVKMMKQPAEYVDDEFPDVCLRRKPNRQDTVEGTKRSAVVGEVATKGKKGVSRSDSKVGQDNDRGKKVSIGGNHILADPKKAAKLKKEDSASDSVNDSYLKRVKSKIYKNKNDNGSNASSGRDILPSMPNIVETSKSNKKSKKKKGSQVKDAEQPPPQDFEVPELRKSISQFDFRLIRQTSNLERIRPKTFGLRTSCSNLGIPELVDGPAAGATDTSPKPVLAKSKSSSAINLNLLRTRRNKLLEQAKRNCKIVQNEFDFIAFGAVRSAGVQVSRKFGSHTLTNSIGGGLDWNPANATGGEVKPGQPVTRTGSDRRPDAVREESRVHPEAQDHHVDHESDAAHQDSTVSLPAYTGNKKRTSTNINRSGSVKEEQSEKRKQRRNISDPLRNTASETVDLDQQGLSYQTNSGNSSNSSLSSSRSSESPSTSLDAVSGFTTTHPAGSGWDSDMEVEADPPDWQSSVPEEELANLHPHEKKRQDVINELFHTERSHLRNLRVLDCVFKKPLQNSKLLKQEDINLIFSNLNDLVEIHSHLNTAMKSKRKESPVIGDIGDMMLNMFDGEMGENFQSSAAAFCERQQLALEFIKERRKKDSRFDSFLTECEKNNLCRRLPLQGILPTEMQRLSKYPLLLERLIDSEEKNKQRDPELTQAELGKLRQAHDRSKEILNYVNEAAKIACNRARLEDIQRHLDTSVFEKTDHAIVNEFKNLDLTRYSLIHEGTMNLRRPNKQPVALHIVLLEEAVVLLQKDTERYVLKFFQAGTPNQQPLAPVIKTSTLLVRANAASKSSLFLVNTSTQNSQMYDLLARDSSERDTWFKHISDAAEAYNRREGKSKRSEPAPDAEEAETLQDLPNARDISERAEHVTAEAPSGGETDSSGPSCESSKRNSDVIDEERDKRLSQSDNENPNANEVTGGGLTLKLAADDWPLVQPTEVHVAVPPVHTAEPVLTPIEQIRRKDEEVRRALADKEGLVADLLSIPREDYQLIADIASEETHSKSVCDREPSELVLAAVFQADQLLAAVNDSLNISEADAVLATGGKHASCASNESLVSRQNNYLPSVPVHRLQEIATTLSTQLTTLLSVIRQRDEERERLRKELQRTREQLHERLLLHAPQNADADFPTLECMQPGDLEKIEESPTENESN